MHAVHTKMNLSTVKWAQWDKIQSRELLGRFICVCIALCTIVAHSIAQNRPDSFPSYPPDNHHCSDDVYLREGRMGRKHRVFPGTRPSGLAASAEKHPQKVNASYGVACACWLSGSVRRAASATYHWRCRLHPHYQQWRYASRAESLQMHNTHWWVCTVCLGL